MGQANAQGIQKILHLDAKYDNFPTWEEGLEFDVDGVRVTAIATHQWRQESVRIVAPFEVEGDDYVQGFRPPLIALGAAMMTRQKRLAASGLTLRDDCIRMARNTYRLHATYLRLKPEIDRAQEEFLSVFRDELALLHQEMIAAQDRLRLGKQALRRQLHAQELDQKQYAARLKPLQEEVGQCEGKHGRLRFDVDHELRTIKTSAIHLALAGKIDGWAPLSLGRG